MSGIDLLQAEVDHLQAKRLSERRSHELLRLSTQIMTLMFAIAVLKETP